MLNDYDYELYPIVCTQSVLVWWTIH